MQENLKIRNKKVKKVRSIWTFNCFFRPNVAMSAHQ